MLWRWTRLGTDLVGRQGAPLLQVLNEKARYFDGKITMHALNHTLVLAGVRRVVVVS